MSGAEVTYDNHIRDDTSHIDQTSLDDCIRLCQVGVVQEWCLAVVRVYEGIKQANCVKDPMLTAQTDLWLWIDELTVVMTKKSKIVASKMG